jgi:hypothetical protein
LLPCSAFLHLQTLRSFEADVVTELFHVYIIILNRSHIVMRYFASTGQLNHYNYVYRLVAYSYTL